MDKIELVWDMLTERQKQEVRETDNPMATLEELTQYVFRRNPKGLEYV